MLVIPISIIFPVTSSGPCDTPVKPEQLIGVGVMLAVRVGRGVLDGVKVNVGVNVKLGVTRTGVFPEDGMFVDVKVRKAVGVLVKALVGNFDGVAVSAENPLGRADPRIGMDIKNVRALADTISTGSIGMIEMMGS